MNLSTPTNSIRNTKRSTLATFKGFKELNLAIWTNPNLEVSVLPSINGAKSQRVVREYTLSQASTYLGKTEANFRLFLIENGIRSDGEHNGTPLFSEDLLDLIESHGYLFDYAKKWRVIGHHDEADKILQAAQDAFSLNALASSANLSKKRVKKRFSKIHENTEDWGDDSEESLIEVTYI